jgi:NRPS condensation-like uncharacterized protein
VNRRSPRGTDADQLPKAAFELIDELACYYDTSADPNTVHVEALVPGRVDYPTLRQAVAGALTATPRARSRMAPGPALRSRYTWEFPPVPDIDPVSRTTWSGESELAAARARFLASSPPLHLSPPVRLLLASGPGADCVILNAHHAALDGMSCLELLRDIAARYRGITGEPTLGGPAPDVPAEPPAQEPPPVRPSSPPPPGPVPGARARAVAGMLRHRAARIAAEPKPRGQRDGGGVHLLLVPTVPKLPGATVNDMLLAALIATISRWNAARRRPPRAVRITVPVDVRGPGLRKAAGNHSKIVTVTVDPPEAGDDLSALLAEVTRQTSVLRRARPQQPSAGALGVAPAWCPVALKRLAVRFALRAIGRIVCDTCMLTNLGNVADPPWSGLGGPVRVAITSAARMPRGLSVGAATADGQLQVAFRYRYELLDEAAAARFAACYAAVLDELGNGAISEGGNTRGPAGRTAQDPRVPGR